MTTIGVQKWGFGICPGENEDVPGIEITHDAFVKIRGIESIEGPCINGTIGVTVWSDAYNSVEDAKAAIIKVAESLGLTVEDDER